MFIGMYGLESNDWVSEVRRPIAEMRNFVESLKVRNGIALDQIREGHATLYEARQTLELAKKANHSLWW
jgi:hypothetical protein